MSYGILIQESEDRMRTLIAEQMQTLQAHILDMEQSVDLRHNADMRAIKRWQETTGRHLVWPDHADMCVWLLERLDEAETRIDTMSKMTEEQYSGLWDKLSSSSNPWKHPELYAQPGEKRSQWRVRVGLMQKSFKEVCAQ